MSGWTITATGPLGDRLERALPAALDTINRCIRSGRTSAEPARYLSAGGGYVEPWTRDAAINAWSGVSALDPGLARDTLMMVCADGCVVQDDQWWDQVIWIVAAAHHARLTGDADFARQAAVIGRATIAVAERDRREPVTGLFRGPALMQDGISGYPAELVDPSCESSFVLDHPATHGIVCLSTNAVYAMAYDALADLHGPAGGPFRDEADAVRRRLAEVFVQPDGSLAYIVDPQISPARVHVLQEALGLAFAVLSGACTSHASARDLLASARREPRGIALVAPHVQQFTEAMPGRHNVICWPMAVGMWGRAAARVGSPLELQRALDDLLSLIEGSDHQFYEIYNATTGEVDGGWQVGRHWRSEPDQTWSATALTGLLLYGVLGLHADESGVWAQPCLPDGITSLTLEGVLIQGAPHSFSIAGASGVGERQPVTPHTALTVTRGQGGRA